MRPVQPHTVGSRLYQVEAITQVWCQGEIPLTTPCGLEYSLQNYTRVWRVVLSYREKLRGELEYRAVHFAHLPRVGVLPHAGPQEKMRDLRVGDDLVLEGVAERLTFAEHGNSFNSFLPLEHRRAQLVDPFDRKELA